VRFFLKAAHILSGRRVFREQRFLLKLLPLHGQLLEVGFLICIIFVGETFVLFVQEKR